MAVYKGFNMPLSEALEIEFARELMSYAMVKHWKVQNYLHSKKEIRFNY
jgi:hypothetical protein